MAEQTHEFDCPLCGGSFEVETQWLGQAIPCPHCNQDVELPAAEELTAAEQEIEEQETGEPETPASPPPPADKPAASNEQQLKAPPKPAPAPRKLSLEERAALRKRVNLAIALTGAVLLIVLFFILS